ncbi:MULTISPECIES: hypothetical protein [unclassified Streptomyces]|uniref:hypothetical protein n=1 Tax=unclassified Streptomyces TaxID=2593676 RepID=UPI00235F26A7|nr:hypothetical protein [Streptomyces sp. MMBL 11-1]
MADGELRRDPASRDRRDPASRGPRDGRDAEGAADEVEDAQESDAARRRRRVQFLRELHEAKQLRDRVQPRRARAARMRQQMRMRTFRW